MTPTPTRADERKDRRARVKKGRYEQYVKESLAAKGYTLLKINWNKRVIHYLDDVNNKKVQGFYGL